ncbi:transcriptional regulator [Streptomyces olivaceoviridis]|uniref:Scr1 family TA system antitoxin-like transcriptional regulator n=1 Tax=Streptomyces olivaceoviridis TaxID=1921 RepID=UPI0016775309|nr:Scr1 family TA system antitoxin-like transcriptional regulator [Streptomyces olivaceoviridis]GGZ07310.1 transcriptional regulator [Streptomyces olivaceoviridis]
MSVNGEAVRVRTGTDQSEEPGWEVDPNDDWALAVVATVGRQLRLRREAAGMRVGEFAVAVGYGEDLVYKIEAGKRIPRPEYLDTADEVLDAKGLIAAMREDVKKVRYPKKVRDLAQLEARAVEIGVYECSSIAGLLQTPDYARALFEQQFERPLEVGRLNNVSLQVMPMDSVAHPGMSGRIELLKFEDGTAVGRSDGAFNGRPASDPRQLRILDLRYGTIRAQALPPGETLALIERMLGET